jgi:hypothetical protein
MPCTRTQRCDNLHCAAQAIVTLQANIVMTGRREHALRFINFNIGIQKYATSVPGGGPHFRTSKTTRTECLLCSLPEVSKLVAVISNRTSTCTKACFSGTGPHPV